RTARIRLGPLDLSAPFIQPPDKGEKAKLIIRPEDIQIESANKAGLKGVVKFALYQGSMNDYTIDTEVGELRIIDYQSKGTLLNRGTHVSLTFREDHILIIK
ncbi:MAG: TOBE domain-containing protein, partial [Spirochaetes bacterium]|nr:TOBE domain-containing protein [Spirochaetota bacterium]